jgi:hypothetical protein
MHLWFLCDTGHEQWFERDRKILLCTCRATTVKVEFQNAHLFLCKIWIYINVYFRLMSNRKAFLNTGIEPVLKHWIQMNVAQCWYPSFMLDMWRHCSEINERGIVQFVSGVQYTSEVCVWSNALHVQHFQHTPPSLGVILCYYHIIFIFSSFVIPRSRFQ